MLLKSKNGVQRKPFVKSTILQTDNDVDKKRHIEKKKLHQISEAFADRTGTSPHSIVGIELVPTGLWG